MEALTLEQFNNNTYLVPGMLCICRSKQFENQTRSRREIQENSKLQNFGEICLPQILQASAWSLKNGKKYFYDQRTEVYPYGSFKTRRFPIKVKIGVVLKTQGDDRY